MAVQRSRRRLAASFSALLPEELPSGSIPSPKATFAIATGAACLAAVLESARQMLFSDGAPRLRTTQNSQLLHLVAAYQLVLSWLGVRIQAAEHGMLRHVELRASSQTSVK